MNKNLSHSLWIIILASLAFIPLIGRLHLFDWDEINFAESAREMLITKDYLTVRIFFEPFWEKPPLFIWFQVLSMKLFGVNEFAARFPNAVAGIATLLFLYYAGSKLINQKFGIIWAVIHGVSILPFLYFKSGIIDPWFNLFIYMGIYFYLNTQKELSNRLKYRWILLSALFMGLAVLSKGPVAILVFGLLAVLLLILGRFRLEMKAGHVFAFIGLFILTGGFWFILQIFSGNWQTIVDFIVYQIRLFTEKDAGHGGFPFYHFVVLFFGVFPASVFMILAHKKIAVESDKFMYHRKAMLGLFWIVLILFSIVKTKIVHYSSLCYFPMSFLAAWVVYNFIEGKVSIPKWLRITTLTMAVLYGLIIAAFPLFDHYKQGFIDKAYISHSFTIGNLQAEAGWNGLEFLVGFVIILTYAYAFVLFNRQKVKNAFISMAIGSALFIYLTVIFVAPKVEKYSQNAAIGFFKSLKDKDVYIQTFYKSYAMLFYTKALPQKNPDAFNLHWLIYGPIDKDAYFVLRIDKKKSTLSKYPEIEIIEEKNGYVFCKRTKKTE